MAVTSNDRFSKDAFLRRFIPPFAGGHPGTDLLCNGMHAILRRDRSLWQSVATALRTRKENRFIRAMYGCLVAVVNEEPSEFSSSMREMLKFNRRTDLHLGMDKIVCVEAHAFINVAGMVSPELIDDWQSRSLRLGAWVPPCVPREDGL